MLAVDLLYRLGCVRDTSGRVLVRKRRTWLGQDTVRLGPPELEMPLLVVPYAGIQVLVEELVREGRPLQVHIRPGYRRVLLPSICQYLRLRGSYHGVLPCGGDVVHLVVLGPRPHVVFGKDGSARMAYHLSTVHGAAGRRLGPHLVVADEHPHPPDVGLEGREGVAGRNLPELVLGHVDLAVPAHQFAPAAKEVGHVVYPVPLEGVVARYDEHGVFLGNRPQTLGHERCLPFDRGAKYRPVVQERHAQAQPREVLGEHHEVAPLPPGTVQKLLVPGYPELYRAEQVLHGEIFAEGVGPEALAARNAVGLYGSEPDLISFYITESCIGPM